MPMGLDNGGSRADVTNALGLEASLLPSVHAVLVEESLGQLVPLRLPVADPRCSDGDAALLALPVQLVEGRTRVQDQWHLRRHNRRVNIAPP